LTIVLDGLNIPSSCHVSRWRASPLYVDFPGGRRSSDLLLTALSKLPFSLIYSTTTTVSTDSSSIHSLHRSLVSFSPLSLYHLHLHITFDEIWGPKMISKRGPQRPLLTRICPRVIFLERSRGVSQGKPNVACMTRLCLFPPPLAVAGDFSRAKLVESRKDWLWGKCSPFRRAAVVEARMWMPLLPLAVSLLTTQPPFHHHHLTKQHPVELKVDVIDSLVRYLVDI
jgi:hypothetical protein